MRREEDLFVSTTRGGGGGYSNRSSDLRGRRNRRHTDGSGRRRSLSDPDEMIFRIPTDDDSAEEAENVNSNNTYPRSSMHNQRANSRRRSSLLPKPSTYHSKHGVVGRVGDEGIVTDPFASESLTLGGMDSGRLSMGVYGMFENF
jgi:hypothetical protein